MGADGVRSGWEAGTRVPVTGPVCDGSGLGDLGDLGDGSGDVRVSGFAWPCAEAQAHWVECLTQAEAAELATYAREQLMVWMAGAGLHPLRVFYRWGIAALFLRVRVPDSVARLVWGMRGGGAGMRRMERFVFESIKPEEGWRRTRELVEVALHESALRGRYAVQAEDGSLADLLEWCATEGLVVPAGVDGEVFVDDAREVARAAMRLSCRWLAGSGTGPLPVLQRVYALIFYRYKSVGQGMTGHDLAALVRQCRATFCEETSRWFEDPGEFLLGYRPKSSTGQKSADSAEVYRANAARHCPRRQLSGTAGLDAGVREAAEDRDGADRRSAEWRAARIAEDWETASAWLSFVGDAGERRSRFGVLSEEVLECVRVLREREEREERSSGVVENRSGAEIDGAKRSQLK